MGIDIHDFGSSAGVFELARPQEGQSLLNLPLLSNSMPHFRQLLVVTISVFSN